MAFKFSDHEEVDDIELVNETFRPFYKKNDEGKFSIDPALAPAAAAWDGINKSNMDIRTENKTLKKSSIDLSPLSEYGSTPQEIRETIARQKQELSDALDKKKDAVNPEKIRTEMNKSFEDKTKLMQARNQALENQLYQTLVTNEATNAILQEKGNVKILMPFITENVKMVEVDGRLVPRVLDKDGDVRIGGTGTPMTVPELVQSFRKEKDFETLFESDRKTGSGAASDRVATGGNTPKTLNAAQKIASGLANLTDM